MSKVVDFYFDIGSPYAYLASTQIEMACKIAEATVNWKPFLLGAVFKASGNQSPMMAYAKVPNKMKYMQRDMFDWAKVYCVRFSMPSNFPINTIKPMRACIAAEEQGKLKELAVALYEALWVDDKKIEDPDVIKAIADDIRLDGDLIIKRIEDDDIKEKLKENTNTAIELGAFGAPTMVYKDHMWWGNDRLTVMAAMVRDM